MDILYLLIPLSVVLVFLIIGVFAWAVNSGQFDDLEREGERILEPESQSHEPAGALVDDDQALQGSPSRQSGDHQPGVETKGAFDGR